MTIRSAEDADVQATFLATLVDEWVRCGVTDVVVGAGQRSTLGAGTLEAHPKLRVHTMVDERSGSYFALGLAMETGRPTLLWVTSGTATTEVSAAVMEANQALVPLIVCTADRPPELQHARDWQTADQRYLYMGATRWSFNPGVADAAMSGSWRSIAARAYGEALYNAKGPGPVHLNLPIREPWEFAYGELPAGRSGELPWHQWKPLSAIDELVSLPRRGVIIAGDERLDTGLAIEAARSLGWPILAETRSDLRVPADVVVASADVLARSPRFCAEVKPEVVLRFGRPGISKSVAAWLKGSDTQEWLVDPHGIWAGRTSEANVIVTADHREVCKRIIDQTPQAAPSEWLQMWKSLDKTAQLSIDEFMSDNSTGTLTEAVIGRELTEIVPPESNVFGGTSMPVRDVEWYARPRVDVKVYANRGVSGLEGLVSTAAGIARANPQRSNVALVGDLGFLYDTNAMWTLRSMASDLQLAIVVVDNRGGGIFSLFPHLRGLGDDVFQKVVGTPHDVDILSVAASFDIPTRTATTVEELASAVNDAIDAGGISVVYVRTDGRASMDFRVALHKHVVAQLEQTHFS